MNWKVDWVKREKKDVLIFKVLKAENVWSNYDNKNRLWGYYESNYESAYWSNQFKSKSFKKLKEIILKSLV